MPAFTVQCGAMLAATPTAVSSIMGLFDADYVARHERGIAWLATATTLDDALAAEEARSLVFTTEEPMEGEGLRALERAVQRRAHGRR